MGGEKRWEPGDTFGGEGRLEPGYTFGGEGRLEPGYTFGGEKRWELGEATYVFPPVKVFAGVGVVGVTCFRPVRRVRPLRRKRPVCPGLRCSTGGVGWEAEPRFNRGGRDRGRGFSESTIPRFYADGRAGRSHARPGREAPLAIVSAVRTDNSRRRADYGRESIGVSIARAH